VAYAGDLAIVAFLVSAVFTIIWGMLPSRDARLPTAVVTSSDHPPKRDALARHVIVVAVIVAVLAVALVAALAIISNRFSGKWSG
jgi:hypothetical protein